MTGAITGSILNNAQFNLNRSDNIKTSVTMTGNGLFEHIGTGETTITGDSSLFSGTTNIRTGTLFVDGQLSSAATAPAGQTSLNVLSGAALGGSGTVGSTTIQNGGSLLGHQGNVLTVNGDLNFQPNAQLDIGLGQPSNQGLFNVTGDLLLDGVMNITDLGGFSPGVYRIIDYAGTIDDQTMVFGALPDGITSNDLQIQTAVPQQVNLINTAGVLLNFWDGTNTISDGVVDGGDGVWDATNTNWTNADGTLNAAWDRSFAIFQGATGTVEVDHSKGAISAEGMQFVTDGYEIKGQSINLTSPLGIIRVGAGAGAENVTATINAELTGNAAVVKTDMGTLILGGQNTYTGGTIVRDGILQVAADGNLGAAAGAVTLEGGTLRNSAAFTTARSFVMGDGGGTIDTQGDLTVTGVISGDESLTKTGSASLILTADNTYGEGTVIEAGAIHLGNGGTSGWITGHVSNDGQLVFNRSDNVTFNDTITGSGGVIQAGNGTTTLTADNGFLIGQSEVRAGSLVVMGEVGGTMLVSGGNLRGVGTVGDTTLSQEGKIAPGVSDIGTLTIFGDYIGAGGTLEIKANLGDDSSLSDRLLVTGSTSGTTRVDVIKLGGSGAPTTDGIKIVDVRGISDGTFTLLGDYVFEGDPAIVAGAYAYRLFQDGITTPNDGDWYLRSSLIDDGSSTPGEVPPNGNTPTVPPHYQPGVPAYEAYPQALLGLNGLNTLQQRVGNRSWELGGNGAGQYAVDGSERNGAWARIEGGRSTLNPQYSDTAGKYRQNSAFIQGGYDRVVSSDGNGTVVVGASLNTAYGKTRIGSRHGDGHIKTEGYGVGLSATWYRPDGLYVDGQAQTMWYRSDLTSSLVPEKLVRRNHGTGYALSAEVGRAFSMVGNWTWTPQAQLRYSSVDFSTFEDTFDTQVKMGKGNELTGRVGLGISHDNSWRAQSGTLSRAHIYGIANINYDFQNKNRVEVYETPIQARIPRLGAEAGVGGTYSWNNARYALYGEATVGTLTDDFGHSNDVRGQVGFRMNW